MFGLLRRLFGSTGDAPQVDARECRKVLIRYGRRLVEAELTPIQSKGFVGQVDVGGDRFLLRYDCTATEGGEDTRRWYPSSGWSDFELSTVLKQPSES